MHRNPAFDAIQEDLHLAWVRGFVWGAAVALVIIFVFAVLHG